MFALAAAGVEDCCHFSAVTTQERLPLMPKSAALNASLQPLLQLFLRPLSGLTAPAYENYEGERVVYERGGDHLG